MKNDKINNKLQAKKHLIREKKEKIKKAQSTFFERIKNFFSKNKINL